MCVITSSALVLVVLSHYCLGGMSVLSLNSMVSPPSKSLEDMDARVSSHQFLVPSCAPATTVSGNLLLMCITYLQIRPHFASPTESNAFTWLHPLFPIICCLSLNAVFTSTRSVLHPCCACRGPPHSQKFLSTADNDNTSFIETFLCHIKIKKRVSQELCHSLAGNIREKMCTKLLMFHQGPETVPSGAFHRPRCCLQFTSGTFNNSHRGVCTCSVVIANGNYQHFL